MKPKLVIKGQGALFYDQVEKETIGADEMNIAEYPISLLSRKPLAGINTIEYYDGEKSWVVTGSAKYGLPLGGDQDMYVAIMEAWKEFGFADRKIEIVSVFRLLKSMGMPTTKQYYERFVLAVERLAGITIYAKNAFYDKTGRKHETVMGFHLFEDFKITKVKGRGGRDNEPRGYIRASDTLWASVRKGYIKNLNIMFYRQLSSPCAKRIYRFLDKKRFLGNSFRMNVVMFAKKMGLMAGSTRYYPSHIKKDLTPALEELKGRVFSSFFGTINRRKQERKTYNACSLRKKSREGFEVHNARGQR